MAGGGRLRILLVISSLNRGGAQRTMTELAGWLAARDHAVCLLTLHGSTQPEYRLGVRVERQSLDIPISGETTGIITKTRRGIRTLYELRRSTRRFQPDVVVSFIHATNVRVLLSLAGTRIPVIVSERNDPYLSEVGRFVEVLRRLLYPNAARLVVQSDRSLEWARARGLERVEIIPNAVRAMRVATDVHESRNLVAMGRLHPQKGFDLLIEAFATVAPKYPEWSLLIFGEGRERAFLQGLIDSHGVGNRVFLAGLTDDPEDVLLSAGGFVLSSRYEGFPTVLLEALASGLPVLATDCPSGPKEILDHNVNGLLVPPGQVNMLAEGLERLLGSASLREQLAKSAPQSVMRYGHEKVFGSWEWLLADAVGHGATPGVDGER